VSEALGHASIGITLDTYSHVMPTMSQLAAEALEEVFREVAGGNLVATRRHLLCGRRHLRC
jgi:hypothetical protein